MYSSFKRLKQIFRRRKGRENIIPNDVQEIHKSESSHPSIVRDLSSGFVLRGLLKKIIERRRWKFLPDDEFHWSDSHLSIVRDYFLIAYPTCDFRELPSAEMLNDTLQDRYVRPNSEVRADIAAFLTEELQELFMVPRLKNFHIKKHQLVEAFMSFLLQLLYHKTDWIVGPCKDRIENLEKELRFLLTILGDTSLMLWDDEHEEIHNLSAEFEAVANEAGSLVHSLFFSSDRAFEEMDEGIGVVSNHIDLLKDNIRKFLNQPSLLSFSRSAHVTPKTSVADSLLIIDSLSYFLEDLMNREDNLLVDEAKDQINVLHQDLVFVQSLIKDIGSPRSSEIGGLKEPLMRIGDMAHQAEYLIISSLVGDAPSWYLFNRITDINNKIELVGTEIQEITEKYKFGGLNVAKDLNAQLSFQAKRDFEADDVTVGLEDSITHLLDQLVGGLERLQVISIVGMPGLGKTTLAMKLYNHPSVTYFFDKRSWCVISQTCVRKRTLANILINMNIEFDKDRILNMEEQSLLELIYKTLKGRRYLIVMDDIWDSHVWDDWGRYFPDDRNGSRVLFTSRNKDVAPPTSKIYALPSLSNDQSWELLRKKVFADKACPPELLGIGKEIAANCRGLPLAVVVISGILSTMDKEKSTWEEVGKNLASYIFYGGDNSTAQILELSYKHLPDHLKPCFLYFGAFFQTDREIPVRKLMRLWVAEGFVRKGDGKSAEDVAEECLMELIDKSLVMVAKRRSDGGVRTCLIHDLLRDLCLKKSEEENFLKFLKNNIFSIYEKGHRLQAPEHSIASSYCKNARSFHGYERSSPFYVRDMTLVRVFHFDYNALRFTNLVGIEFLVNLRYLVTCSFPTSIGNLVNLEYLRVETSETVYLPAAVSNMTKLRYIHVGAEAVYDKDFTGSRPNNLEFLSRIAIRELKDEEMLKSSPHLRKLKCKYDPLISETEEIRFVDLRVLTQLESLNMELCRYGINITSLSTSIRKLTLSRSNSRDLSIIGKLENLEILKLRNHAFMGQRWDTGDGEFQKLRFFKLEDTNLTQWTVASSQHFPNLQRLVLKYCYFLEGIPCEIGEITTLQMIEVKGLCPQSLVESAKTIQQQQLEMANDELMVIITTDVTNLSF